LLAYPRGRRYPLPIMIAGIVPDDVYLVMPDWLLWVFVAVALRFLAFGANRVVTGGVRFATALGM